MTIQQIIALRVKEIRTGHGWSQEELAHRSGIHRTYISGLERGVRNPTVGLMAVLATALGATVSELTRMP